MSTYNDHSQFKHPLPLNEDDVNQYQRNAPLIVYCRRCRNIFSPDEAWVERYLQKHYSDRDPTITRQVLLRKIAYWQERKVQVTGITRDLRGRVELIWTEEAVAPKSEPAGLLSRLRQWFKK